MNLKKILILVLFNLVIIFIGGNKYNFLSDEIMFMRFSHDGIETKGLVIQEIPTTCWLGRTYINCFYPVVKFKTFDGTEVVFSDSHKYTTNGSLYGKLSDVDVLYSKSNPQIARAFQGNDLKENTIAGAIWFLFTMGILVFIDVIFVKNNKIKKTKNRSIFLRLPKGNNSIKKKQ